VSFVLRSSNLDVIHRDCQLPASNGSLGCPKSSTSEVNAARSAALVEGPLGIGLAAGAAIAAGAGVWLLLAPAPAPATRAVQIAPSVSATGAMLTVRGEY